MRRRRADRARIRDTRKTLPGLRALEKAAVRAGGGFNHRESLSDAVLIKDNHLADLGITEAVRPRAGAVARARTVEVECDTLEQVEEAVAAGADLVLLDNMTPDEVRACVLAARTAPRVPRRGVGRHHARDRRAYADAGADFISIGAITHRRRRSTSRSTSIDPRPTRTEGALTMLLAIDTGNTQTVIGLFDGPELADHWRIATIAARTSDELALMIQQFLGVPRLLVRRAGDRRRDRVRRPERHRRAARDDASATSASRRWCSSPACAPGMPILYDNPKEVGADRIANAVGAYDLYGGPTIVVDFGTANTVEAISAKGEYLGGAIFPGIEISMDALFERAAALRSVELVPPKNVIGKSTVESIQSGAVYGFSGQVDAIVDRFEAELGECTVVATGGLAELIMPLSGRSSTTSRGSRSTACASSSSATTDAPGRCVSGSPSTAKVLPSGSLNDAIRPPPACGEIPFASVP